MKIATLGPKGTYSWRAANKLFANEQIILHETIADVLSSVSGGKAHKAIVPLDNTINGVVTESLDGLYDRGLLIENELEISIDHALCAIDSSIKPTQVKKIYSHLQALSQCHDYLAKNYLGVAHVPTVSTTSGMQIIAKTKDKNAVAIGPPETAKMYGLKIIKRDISDRQSNITRFVVCVPKSDAKKSLDHIFMAVEPQDDRPGLLHDILTIIKEE